MSSNYLIEKINSPNHYTGRSGFKPQLIVLHICDGTYEGTKGWFLNPNSQVSSNYIVGQSGQICEAVPIVNAAWCNGTSSNSSASTFYGNSTNNIVKANGSNANYYSVSIECEGYYSKTKGALTDKQLDALVWLIKKIQADIKAQFGEAIPSDRQHIIGHYEVNPKTKPCCPGEKFPWDALMAKLNGGNDNPAKMYKVQIGAFNDKRYADAMLADASKKGFAPCLKYYESEKKWKVQLGAYTEKSNADNMLTKAKAAGYKDAWIVTE